MKRKIAKSGEPLRYLRSLVLQSNRPASDPCITWPYNKSAKGYPLVVFEGRQLTASRLLCEMVNGKPKRGQNAAHSCGMGHDSCIAPYHLSWKTQKENSEDSKRHGTRIFGSYVANSVLDDEKVRRIRVRLRRGDSQRQIAYDYGVNPSTISYIASYKTWSHVNV